MTPPDAGGRLFDLWADSEVKVRLVAFYRRNPGIVETVDGLGRRLARPAPQLQAALRDLVELGMMRERSVGGRSVFLFDRGRFAQLQDVVEAEIGRRLGGGAA